MEHFPEPLRVEAAHFDGESRWWKLTHYYRYISSVGVITVPTGTKTDLASIPKAFRSIFDPAGPWLGSAIIHDFLYSKSSDLNFRMSRKKCDEIFLEAMFNSGIGWERNVIYAAVRVGGWKSFKKK